MFSGRHGVWFLPIMEVHRADCDVDVLPSKFIIIVKTSPSPPEEYVVSWFDGILICSSTWEEHLDAVRRVFKKLHRIRLSVNSTKCNFSSSSQ